jgi:hypothetical protein
VWNCGYFQGFSGQYAQVSLRPRLCGGERGIRNPVIIAKDLHGKLLKLRVVELYELLVLPFYGLAEAKNQCTW